MILSLEKGTKLIKLARKSIEAKFSIVKLSMEPGLRKEFSENRGCFVTLHKEGELRGCIGFPEPIMSLYEGIVEAAKHAAFQDPRFPPLEKKELSQINIEVSVLTKPEQIFVRNPEEYLKKIQIGKDGLIIRGVYSSGLLLPQVATEYRWDTLTFLQQTCLKANLAPDDWQDFNKVRVYKSQSHVFSETEPNGQVIQIM